MSPAHCCPWYASNELISKCRRLSHGQSSIKDKETEVKLCRDIDQPFLYDVRMYNRPYRFEFYDTASPKNYTLLRPGIIILCYDISDRRTLMNVQQVWRKDAIRHYTHANEGIPIMLLGLKRDCRIECDDMIDPQEVRHLSS